MIKFYSKMLIIFTYVSLTVVVSILGRTTSDTNATSKIVGGVNAVKGAYPWFAAIKEYGNYVCGASIVDERNILTATHCININAVAMKKVKIVAGEYNTNNEDGNEQEVRVISAVTHHQYNTRTMYADIAILHLKTPLRFNKNVKPVKFSYAAFDGYAVSKDLECFACGFGAKRRYRIAGSRYLQVANQTFVTNRECQTALNDLDLQDSIENTHICTIDTQTATCQGDSGGPVGCYDKKGIYRQVGIVSWGASDDCTVPPSVNTRVSKYKKWIRDSMIGQKASTNCSNK